MTTRTVEKSQAGSVTAWVRQHAPSLAGLGAAQIAKTVEVCRSPSSPRYGARYSTAASSPEPHWSSPRSSNGSDPSSTKPPGRPCSTPWSTSVARTGPRGPRAAAAARRRVRASRSAAPGRGTGRRARLALPPRDGRRPGHLLTGPGPRGGAPSSRPPSVPYARPRPADDDSPDPREPRRRRGEALVAVCRRATSAGSAPGAGLKTCVYVTMSYADLTARLAGVLPGDDRGGNDHEANDHRGNLHRGNHRGGNHRGGKPPRRQENVERAAGFGVTLGSVDRGSILAPETVRKLACDAGIIPALLGGRGEILEARRHGPDFHARSAQGPLAPGPALHLPRLRCAGPLVRCPPHPALGRLRGAPT